MPQTPLTEVDVFSAAVTVPQAGDFVTVASYIAGAQAMTDRTKFLENRLFGGAYTLALSTAAFDDGADWAWDVTSHSWSTVATVGSTVYFQIQFPHLFATAAGNYPRLSFLRVRTIGNGHGAPPVLADFPMSVAVKRKNAAGTVSTVGGQNDTGTGGGGGTIDTVHDWNPVDLNHELDPLSTYFVEITNENGANAQVSTFLMRIAIDLLAPTS